MEEKKPEDNNSNTDIGIGEVTGISTIAWIAEKLLIPPNEEDGSYPECVLVMAAHFEVMSDLEALHIVKESLEYHKGDPSLSLEYFDELHHLIQAVDGDNIDTHQFDETEEDSASTEETNSDDPDATPTNSVTRDDIARQESANSFAEQLSHKESLKSDSRIDPSSVWSEIKYNACLFRHWSPYPQVRTVTDPFDDPEEECETIRVYVIGTIWVAIAAFVNQFFQPRQPPIQLSVTVVQLFLYPSGRLWQYIFPDWGFRIRGKRYSLNPGPWTQKEQLLATLMASVSNIPAYIDYNVFVQYLPMYFNQKFALNFGYMFMLMFTSQFMGFGMVGLLRKLAVYPSKAMWPTILPTLAVNRALLAPGRKENINGWTLSRYVFFLVVTVGAFLYFFVPNYLFTALSTFNWMTWIAPQDLDLAAITGSFTGLGFNPIPTFDWNVCNSLVQVLFVPIPSLLNMYGGFVFGGLIIASVWYTNVYWSGFLPINSNAVFDNTANNYNVSRVLSNNLFDADKYKDYSPPYYSAANLVLYGGFFALYPLSFFHLCFTEWHLMKNSCIDIYKSVRDWKKSNYHGFKDHFSTTMSKYPETPQWWYLAILLITFGMAIALIEHWDTKAPVWLLIVVIIFNLIFLVPFTVILSVSGAQLSLNVIIEMIVGYSIPGKAVAMMILKAYSVQIQTQAQNFISDQKTGHYGRLPPRAMFRAQMWATLCAGLVVIGVMQYQLTGIPFICDRKYQAAHEKFTCPGETVFFSAAIVWSIIGPKKIFNKQYPMLRWCFLIGFGLAIILAFIHKWGPDLYRKRYPHKKDQVLKIQRRLQTFNPSVFVFGMLNYAPYNLTYMTGGIYAAVFFNIYIRKRWPAWWEKYVYIWGSAMNTGIAVSAIVIFFALQYTNTNLSWWGNNVPTAGIDLVGPGRLKLPEQGFFGPDSANFP
ncbi:Oligopeptide transporter 2 [Yarrowia sp. B02]|nr:Oligopeptide transporter 2 [Yarrowia sp. B02]